MYRQGRNYENLNKCIFDGAAQHEPLNDIDKRLLEKVHKLWYNRNGI